MSAMWRRVQHFLSLRFFGRQNYFSFKNNFRPVENNFFKINLMNFRVRVNSFAFDNFSSVYVVGNSPELGRWHPSKAVKLEIMPDDRVAGDTNATEWSTVVNASGGDISTLQYRYFIGRQFVDIEVGDEDKNVLVLKWETCKDPRSLTKSDLDPVKCDEFGLIDDRVRINNGWLSDRNIKEIRFTLYEKLAVEFSKSFDSSHYNAFKLRVSVKTDEGNECNSADGRIMILSSVVGDENRRMYRVQNDTGEIYSADGNDLITFRIITSIPVEKLDFKVDFILPNDTKPFGTAYMKHFSHPNYFGTLSTDIVDPVQKCNIGKFTSTFLVILPPTDAVQNACLMEETYLAHWKKRPSLNVGHRGMGNSYKKIAEVRENTIGSFQRAFENGAAFVEFDVQFSKDRVPILYHDFHVCLEDDDGKLRQVPVCALTFEELRTSKKIYHVSKIKPMQQSSKFIRLNENPDGKNIDTCFAFPTLPETFNGVSRGAGFNIEIKYPMSTTNGEHECESFFEMNEYVDRILEDVFMYAGDRRLFFSCFCPEICIMLKAKQNRYPVLFLTQGITKRYPSYVNSITSSSDLAVSFVLAENLGGVCFHAEELLHDTSSFERTKAHGLLSFVWGDDLDETKNIDYFRKLGVDGIIFDKSVPV